MVFGGGEPHAIARECGRFVAQNENDLFLDVDCEAAEHRPRDQAGPGEPFEDELIRDRLTGLDAEDGIIDGRGSVTAGLGHGFIITSRLGPECGRELTFGPGAVTDKIK